MLSERTCSIGGLFVACVAALVACGSPNTGVLTSDITCHTDKDCPSPTICQVCNARCVFAPNAACSLEAPCPCGYSCRDQRCQSNLGATTVMCTYNGDCPVDRYCNRALFQCEYPMELGQSTGVACTANSQCGEGEVCTSAPSGGADQCAPNETMECHNAGECPSDYYCNELGQCEHRTC